MEGEYRKLKRPDGTVLHVEICGPDEAPPMVLTHGFCVDSTCWRALKKSLSKQFRLFIWDLPGVGQSTTAPKHDYSLERMADDLGAVLELAENKKAILVGHSMGGMITLTLCSLYPELMRDRIAGIALINTTYINPVHTTIGRAFLKLAQRPLLEPILGLMMHSAPLIWLQDWLLCFERDQGTRKKNTSGSIRLNPICMPAVLARQMQSMFRYDATHVLESISVPTLIVASDRDRATLPEASIFMHRKILASELAVIPSCGHLSVFKGDEQYEELLTRFGTRCYGSIPAEHSTPRVLYQLHASAEAAG